MSSTRLCNSSFESQYAFITSNMDTIHIDNDNSIHIDDYLRNMHLRQKVQTKEIFLICENGHLLDKYESSHRKCHFRHKRNCDLDMNPMTKWHATWQGHFIHQEVIHDKTAKSYKLRKADVLEGNHVLEFQHSPISQQEVQERQHDYCTFHGRVLNWVIDGRDAVKIEYLSHTDSYLVTFEHDFWKYESFVSHDFIYVHCIFRDEDVIVKLTPRDVKSHMIDVFDVHSKEVFIESIKENLNIWTERELPQCILYHNQRGAGCGKTYESIQLLGNDERFRHKTTFIYLTKMHSAKEVIYKEFLEQYTAGKLRSIEAQEDEHSCGKQYKVLFTNTQTLRECKMIIGTIDSFIYALGDKNNKHKDFFKGLLESILDGYNVLPRDGALRYASTVSYLNKECLVIIDEAQDLDCTYIQSIAKIMRSTYIDTYIIGDKLQSIWGQDNIYTYLETHSLPHTHIEYNQGANIVRRFKHSYFKEFVNKLIDFEKHGLYPISGTGTGETCDNGEQHESCPVNVLTQPVVYSNDKDNQKINNLLSKIIMYVRNEVNRHYYLPCNFMFIFPIMKNNVLASMLETNLQRFWMNMFKCPKYKTKVLVNHPYWKDRYNSKQFHRFAFLHKSEEGQPINLKMSAHASRLLSIHASKGQGCEVVFLLNLSEDALHCFSKETGNLVYDSLLHVAITRQKKALYIGIQKKDDDVAARIGDLGNIEHIDSKCSLSNATQSNKIQGIIDFTMEARFQDFSQMYIEPYAYYLLIPESKDNKQVC